MPSLNELFPAILDALGERYGRPGVPHAGLAPFEAMVATVLDRSLDARKRDAAVSALREEGLLDPQSLAEADPSELDDALKSHGLRVAPKALAPLRRLARWLVDRHHGSADDLVDPDSRASTTELRDELLSVNGIGPASADALLNYALSRPVYPVDRATYRVLARHGWIDPDVSYDEARDALERHSPDDRVTLAHLAVWLENLGHDYCRPNVARCERCPLRKFLPVGGPREFGA
jgi:endonuclease-3 related protein